MDTVTHALMGAGISDCRFRKRLGPAATPFALLLSALPDADLLGYLVSSQTAWATHRGYTHALPVLALAGPAFGALGWAVSRRTGSWRQWTVLAWFCLFSHTFLDLLTSWGTMPFLPFSNTRASWDILPILDIFMTAALLASFVANRLLRRERVETFLNPLVYPLVHEHPRRRRAADRFAATAMILAALYIGIGWMQNRQTVRIAGEELAASGFAPVEVRALPVMFTYIAYGVVARNAGGDIRKANYSSWSPKRMEFAEYPAPEGDLAKLAMDTPQGRLFAWHSQGMVGATPPLSGGDGRRIFLVDRRSSVLTDPGKPRFVMEFVFDGQNKATSIRTAMLGFQNVDVRRELEALWLLTRHGDIRGRSGEGR